VLTLIDNRQLCGIEQCCRVRCSDRGAGCRPPSTTNRPTIAVCVPRRWCS
jgi:hypothetical protein